MLSNTEILEAIEHKGILITNFDQKNLQGASYDLTLGEKSYSWSEKKIRKHSTETPLVIRPSEMVIFETRENVKLSKKYSATIHSNVTFGASNGISNISTTIDPGWQGTLAVQIYNHSNKPIRFEFGKEPICTVCIYHLGKEASGEVRRHENREDLWKEFSRIRVDYKEMFIEFISFLNSKGILPLLYLIVAILLYLKK